MNDAPRRRRYRPPGPPITLPAWTRGEALPTDRYLYEAVEHHPLLDENGQPVIGRNGVPVTYDGNPVPPFTIGMLADGYQRLHKALIAEAYEKKRIAEGRPPREKPRKEEPPMDDQRAPPPIGEAKDAQIVLTSAADIKPKRVNWLWRNGLQCGVFNLLAGQSTAGKSTIALSFSATVTSGNKWPDGQTVKQGCVVFWSGEDGVEDTLLPRFLAAGGDTSNMHFIEGVSDGKQKRPFDPATDMAKLTRTVRLLKDVRLIVLDPVAVAVKGDSHKNVETRVSLQPFVDLCAQTGACGLGVHHFTKNTAGGNPLDRVSGSLAFHALPRCVLVAARDQNGGQNARRALMRAKVSNGPDWGGFDYKLDQCSLDDWPDIDAQRVLWGDAIEGSARDILAQFEGKPELAVTKAAAFLREALKGGARMAREVIDEGEANGLSERMLQRALKKLGGRNERVQGIGKSGWWIWEVPGLAS